MCAQINIKNKDLPKFELVKSLIQEDLTVHYPIAHLAAVSSLNEFKLKTGFKQLYRESLYEFLQSERLRYSLQLLSSTDDTIQEIAQKCGYNYSTNFIAVFRKKFKILPTHYRKSHAIQRSISPVSTQYCFTDTPLLSLRPYSARGYSRSG